MALNPQLFPNGMPVPFVNEMFVLARDGVEFEVDKIPASGSVTNSSSFYRIDSVQSFYRKKKEKRTFGVIIHTIAEQLLVNFKIAKR